MKASDNSNSSVKVVNATIVPSIETVREFIRQLKELLARDPAFANAFALYPREVLADRGLPYELQEELMVEIEASGAQVQCVAVSGCAVSGCVVTSWS